MQLLISSSDANNYLQIKDDLDSLRLLVEKSELWIQKKKSSKDADKDDKVNGFDWFISVGLMDLQ